MGGRVGRPDLCDLLDIAVDSACHVAERPPGTAIGRCVRYPEYRLEYVLVEGSYLSAARTKHLSIDAGRHGSDRGSRLVTAVDTARARG